MHPPVPPPVLGLVVAGLALVTSVDPIEVGLLVTDGVGSVPLPPVAVTTDPGFPAATSEPPGITAGPGEMYLLSC